MSSFWEIFTFVTVTPPSLSPSSIWILPRWWLQCSWELMTACGWTETVQSLSLNEEQWHERIRIKIKPQTHTGRTQQTFIHLTSCAYKKHGCSALTFSQEVFKEPSGVVLRVLQMDIGSPPGSWSVVWGLLEAHTENTNISRRPDEGHSLIRSAALLSIVHSQEYSTQYNTLYCWGCCVVMSDIIKGWFFFCGGGWKCILKRIKLFSEIAMWMWTQNFK